MSVASSILGELRSSNIAEWDRIRQPIADFPSRS
jgi:hypothetical protein